MSLQRVIDWILPRETQFYTLLEEQANIALQTSAALLCASESGASFPDIRAAVKKLEKDADRVHDQMMAELAATFVTPIDREDLQRLSKRVEDFVDLLDISARAFLIFNVEAATEPVSEMMVLIHKSSQVLAETFPLLRKSKYNELIERCREVRDLERQSDHVFRDELSRLFHDPTVDAKEILRAREVLDNLERALDKCAAVAETLTHVAVKHA